MKHAKGRGLRRKISKKSDYAVYSQKKAHTKYRSLRNKQDADDFAAKVKKDKVEDFKTRRFKH